MHDIVACVYAKEKRLRSALRHFDKALVCEPLQGIRNYWRFLQKNKIEVKSFIPERNPYKSNSEKRNILHITIGLFAVILTCKS